MRCAATGRARAIEPGHRRGLGNRRRDGQEPRWQRAGEAAGRESSPGDRPGAQARGRVPRRARGDGVTQGAQPTAVGLTIRLTAPDTFFVTAVTAGYLM